MNERLDSQSPADKECDSAYWRDRAEKSEAALREVKTELDPEHMADHDEHQVGCHIEHAYLIAEGALEGKAIPSALTPSSAGTRITPDATLPYYDYVSDEPLEIIEANECSHHEMELSTKRFRRVFNEIHKLRRTLQSASEEIMEYPKVLVRNDVVWLETKEHELVNLEHLARGSVSDKTRNAVVMACEKARAERVKATDATTDSRVNK